MKAFTYKSAATEGDAVKMLGRNAVPLAGGTSLLSLMKESVLGPDVVVNLKSIRGLDLVEASAGGLKIGANVTLSALLESMTVSGGWPALTQALESVGPSSLFVRTVVDRDGRVAEVSLIEGDSFQAAAILDVLRHQRFEPSRVKGRPVAVSFYRLISGTEVRAPLAEVRTPIT